jgi:hypothetical protein
VISCCRKKRKISVRDLLRRADERGRVPARSGKAAAPVHKLLSKRPPEAAAATVRTANNRVIVGRRAAVGSSRPES